MLAGLQVDGVYGTHSWEHMGQSTAHVSKRVCVCVNRAALSLPALHVQQARESSCLLPVQWLLPFTLFNMCNSHFLWLVSKRPRGKSALCGRLPNPSFRNDSTPQPPPPCSQNKHDSKWLTGYVIMIIALFFLGIADNLITRWLLSWLSRIPQSDIYKKVEALTG